MQLKRSGISGARSQRGGFSLIEILIVVVIGAALMTMGTNMRLDIDPSTNHAWITNTATSTTVDQIYFAANFNGVIMTTSTTAQLTVCYNARGFAITTSCSSTLPATITFSRSGSSGSVKIQPLGQIVKS